MQHSLKRLTDHRSGIGAVRAKRFRRDERSEVAQRAGVAKGTLYRYFDTKEELFRATVRHLVASNPTMVKHAPGSGTVAAFGANSAWTVASAISGRRTPAIVRMILAESRTVPDIAAIWHDDVVSPMLNAVASVVAGGQARGELRRGDARLSA